MSKSSIQVQKSATRLCRPCTFFSVSLPDLAGEECKGKWNGRNVTGTYDSRRERIIVKCMYALHCVLSKGFMDHGYLV